ncbi:MAG: hypothetical protein ACFB6S_14905, partial [Geminicoccaceae bacterium]
MNRPQSAHRARFAIVGLTFVGLFGLIGGRMVSLASNDAGPATTTAAAVNAADDRNRAGIVGRKGRLLASN